MSWGHRLSAWLIKYHVHVLIAAVVLTAVAFNQVTRLKLNTSITSLMPEGVASVENLRRVMGKTGSFSSAAVIIESPDAGAALLYAEALRGHLAALPWVASAEYAEDTSVFERHKLLYMETGDLHEVQRRIAARQNYEEHHPRFNVGGTEITVTVREGSEFDEPPPVDFDDIVEKYRGKDGNENTQRTEKLFQSDDGTITLVLVYPQGGATDIAYSRRFTRDLLAAAVAVEPARFHAGMSVAVGGRIKSRVMEFDAAINDVKDSALWSISAILVLLVLYFRRPLAILYIGIPLVMGLLWTFGLSGLVLGSLNAVTIFLVLVLFGLGIDFGIHNLARYDEVRRLGGSAEDGIATILRRTGRASLMAAITTVAGFYSLLITDFRAFYELGFIAGTGIILTFVAMYVVFPALMVVAERTGIYRVAAVPPDKQGSRAREGFPLARTILVSMLLILAACLFFARNVAFENDFGKLSAKLPEQAALNRKVKKVFNERTDRAVVFVPTVAEVRALVDEIEARRVRDTVTPSIARVRSLFTIMPPREEQLERLAIIRDINTKVESLGDNLSEEMRRDLAEIIEYLDIGELTVDMLPPALRRFYTGLPGSGGYLVYIYNIASMSKAENAQAFADDIREIEVGGKIYYPATEALIFVDMRNLMRRDAGVAAIAVTIAVILVLLLNFRSLRTTLIILLPIAVGLGMMMGVMGFFDIRLSIFNMVVVPTVIGIGIDNAIHIFHRYREEGRMSLRYVLRTTGGAAAITTVTTMLGFAGMLTASNQGLVSLAVLACVGIGACLVTSLTVLPATLQLLERRSPREIP